MSRPIHPLAVPHPTRKKSDMCLLYVWSTKVQLRGKAKALTFIPLCRRRRRRLLGSIKYDFSSYFVRCTIKSWFPLFSSFHLHFLSCFNLFLS